MIIIIIVTITAKVLGRLLDTPGPLVSPSVSQQLCQRSAESAHFTDEETKQQEVREGPEPHPSSEVRPGSEACAEESTEPE